MYSKAIFRKKYITSIAASHFFCFQLIDEEFRKLWIEFQFSVTLMLRRNLIACKKYQKVGGNLQSCQLDVTFHPATFAKTRCQPFCDRFQVSQAILGLKIEFSQASDPLTVVTGKKPVRPIKGFPKRQEKTREKNYPFLVEKHFFLKKTCVCSIAVYFSTWKLFG